MAVTITSTTVTYNDGTTVTTLNPASSMGYGTLSSIDTQSNARPIYTYAIGTFQLVRTSGYLQNNTLGGTRVGLYFLDNSNLSAYDVNNYTNLGTALSLGVVSATTVTNDYNYVWWGLAYNYATNNAGNGTIGALVGTWYARGQMFGRGLVSQNHGNFCMMQRVA